MVEILLRSPHFCFTATCVLVCQDVFLKRIEHLNLAKVSWNTIFVSFIVTAVSKVKQTTFPDHKCTVTNIKSMDTDESCNYNVKKTKAQTKLKKKKGGKKTWILLNHVWTKLTKSSLVWDPSELLSDFSIISSALCKVVVDQLDQQNKGCFGDFLSGNKQTESQTHPKLLSWIMIYFLGLNPVAIEDL